MNISPNTVKAFLRLVMIKMGVTSRSRIVAKILSSGAPPEAPEHSPDVFYLALDKRAELLAKKYSTGLTAHETARLSEVERDLEQREVARAEQLNARNDGHRLTRIEAALDRVEEAIRDLPLSVPH